ncbi:MAG: PfkB family carbohydrate kinase [Chloroflexota bacterium]|nr:PfkB family carbohydrate kinase [Chloroflexota bacterium]
MTRRGRVVSAGEALVDLFLKEGASGPQLRVLPGGSSFNVAIGLARLGLDTSFAGRLSSDVFGRLLTRVLDREGVDASLVQHGPEPTPMAVVGRTGPDVVYDFRWIGTADRQYDPAALAPGVFEAFDALHVGSVALGIEPVGARLLALMERLQGRVFLTFDPNVRRDVVDDWPTYVARVHRAAALADIVKVSDADLTAVDETASGTRLPFGRSGPTIVTAGARGATLLRAGHAPLVMAAAPAAAVDTVGAGDAAMAALLFALSEQGLLGPGSIDRVADRTWVEILRFMSTAAAMTCERVGADPPILADLRARLGA